MQFITLTPKPAPLMVHIVHLLRPIPPFQQNFPYEKLQGEIQMLGLYQYGTMCTSISMCRFAPELKFCLQRLLNKH